MKKNAVVYCGSHYGNNPAFAAFAGMTGELLAKKDILSCTAAAVSALWALWLMRPWQRAVT
ncbi:MAG: hypothetical protein ACLR1D_01510 [Dialister sp.]